MLILKNVFFDNNNNTNNNNLFTKLSNYDSPIKKSNNINRVPMVF